MTERNFKAYADIGAGPSLLARRLDVLGTGAGPNFIRQDTLLFGVSQPATDPCPT